MKSNLKFHIKTAIFQFIFYGCMFGLSYTNCVSKEYKHFVPVLLVVFGCIGIGLLSIYPFYVEFRKQRTKALEVKITAMFTQEGNIYVEYLVKQTIDSINSGNRAWQKYFKRQCKRLSVDFPEISDTAVREQIGYFLDEALKRKGLKETNLDDFI